MILTIFILLFLISIIFIIIGFSIDDTIFKVLGFGIMAVICISSITGIDYKNGEIKEICSPFISNFDDSSNNYTTICYNETTTNTNETYMSRTIFIILSVFAIFGALLFPYLEHKKWDGVE